MKALYLAILMAVLSACVHSGAHLAVEGEVVKDRATGLVWQREHADRRMTFRQAVLYCDKLELAHSGDWKLPSRLELLSIVDYESHMPATFDEHFDHTIADAFWTSSEHQMAKTQVFAVDFRDGLSTGLRLGSKQFVRCVEVPEEEIVERANLSWHLEDVPEMPFEKAWSFCDQLVADGHFDWQLPDVYELALLWEQMSPTERQKSAYVWSKHVHLMEPEYYTWAVDFTTGRVIGYHRLLRAGVKCVRDTP